jgi:hypothetical protein
MGGSFVGVVVSGMDGWVSYGMLRQVMKIKA